MAKQTRKELLNEPDEFITATAAATRWINENLKSVLITLTVMAVVIGGGSGYYAWYNASENTAMSKYYAASGDEAKTQAVADEYAGTRAGKMALLRLADLAYAQAEYTKAIENAELFIDSWSKRDIFYWEASMLLAASYISDGKPAESLSYLDACIEDAAAAIKDQAGFYKVNALVALKRGDEAQTLAAQINDPYKALAQAALTHIEE